MDKTNPEEKFKLEETTYGFKWGPALIERVHENHRHNRHYVCVGVSTPKGDIQVYVTKTGKIRVFSPEGEYKVSKD